MQAAVAKLFRQARQTAGAAAALVYPPTCVSCLADLSMLHSGAQLCPECAEQFAWLPPHRCTRCSEALPLGVDDANCPTCTLAKLHFDQVYALGVYRDPLRSAVLRMKRARHEALTRAVAGRLEEVFAARLAELNCDLVLPIPMHWTRRLVRGTNSPELIARSLARTIRVPYAGDLLAAHYRPQVQHTLSRAQRFRNIRGSFFVRPGWNLKDAHLLLVDDTLTTGATCSLAARLLKRAGAKRVDVVVVARTTNLAQQQQELEREETEPENEK